MANNTGLADHLLSTLRSGVMPDGLACRSDGAIWNPRPEADFAASSKRAYMAGYSDGFHGYPFGSGDEGAHGAFSSYRPGFNDGRADADDR